MELAANSAKRFRSTPKRFKLWPYSRNQPRPEGSAKHVMSLLTAVQSATKAPDGLSGSPAMTWGR
jgi:hypothetical protein